MIELPAFPSSCAILRTELRGWIAGLGCSDDDGDDVVTAVNEAVSVVIERADRGPHRIHLAAALIRDDEARSRIAVTVKRSGRWRLVPVDPARHHYGFDIMRACVDEVDIGVDGSGTHLTLVSAPLGTEHPRDRIVHLSRSAVAHAAVLVQQATSARQLARASCARSAAARAAARALRAARREGRRPAAG